MQQNIEQSEPFSGMEEGWNLTNWCIRLPSVTISVLLTCNNVLTSVLLIGV